MTFDDKVLEIPKSLPMLPVRDIVVFPYMILPLYVGRDASIKAVEEALTQNRMIFLDSKRGLRRKSNRRIHSQNRNDRDDHAHAQACRRPSQNSHSRCR